MPELPEVETIRRDLERAILNKRIEKVEIKTAKSVKEPNPQEFKRRIERESFKNILRRGKVLILELSSGEFVVIHLRLTGVLTYGERDLMSRVNFFLSDGKYLNFNDARLLGEIRLLKDWQALPFIKTMGPEPLEKDFTSEKFQEMLKTKKTKIKPLLMDQAFLAGVGNVYAVEALFRTGVHPFRTASDLKPEEVKNLYQNIKDVLEEAIKYRGSSVDTYRDLSGQKGKFEPKLQVYGREGQPCYRCKTKIKRVELGGRGTYFCPKCQK